MNHAHGTLTKSGGCGCGCSGGGKSAPPRPCSCQKKGCQECETHGLVRPRFFSGQLLTEDDLEALTSYVVSKQRLHTRHLHGDGVVCGLEVSCSPCGGGTVVVQPGYALDCCGNDIVVPCATELDILSMIRQLRIDNRGGHDCGDPCTDSKAARRKAPEASPLGGLRKQSSASTVATPTPPPPPSAAQPAPETGARVPVVPKPGEPEPDNLFRERYCLYVRYCETPADPVKPYVQDEPCGDGACEFTRVREGYRFELRCPEDHKPAPTLEDRIKQCANFDELTSAVKSQQINEVRSLRTEHALNLIDNGQPLTLAPDDPNALISRTETLRQFATAYPITPGQPADVQPTDAELRRVIDAYGDLARVTARVGVVDTPLTPEVVNLSKSARTALADVEPLLRGRLDLFTSTEDVLTTRAILDNTRTFVIEDAPVELKKSEQAQVFMLGGVLSQELLGHDAQQLTQMHQWLKRRIGSGVASDCQLFADFQSIQIDRQSKDPQEWRRVRQRLGEILKRYIKACFCAAMLPPCPPCDDTAVLLACLTVEECEVVDVCNLERKFVLSWPAMRYWVPYFGQVGAMVEELCCPADKYDRVKTANYIATQPFGTKIMTLRDPSLAANLREGILTRSGSVAARAARLTPLESALHFAQPAGEAGVDRLAHLLSRSIQPDAGEVPMAFETLVMPQGEPLAEALRSPEPRRLINELIDNRVAELRPQSDLTNIVGEVETRLKDVDKTVGDLAREVKRRPTAADLAVAAPVRKLASTASDMNKRIEKVNADLLAQVTLLQKRIETLERK